MTKQLKSVFIVLLVIAAIAAFFWIAKNLGGGESVESEKPVVICKPQNAPPESQECFWTAHIHFHLHVFRGTQEVPIKFEEGELQALHTHAGENLVHWHGLIPVDPKTKEVTDWSALEVQRIVSDFNLQQGGTPKFIVNGQEVATSYIWKDGDVIEIRYE
jgi:hypothetical protein